MKSILSLLLFWSLVVSATAQRHVSRFVSEPCPPNATASPDPHMNCGRLLVPENRSSAESPEITLFVVQLSARKTSSNGPIIYLAGGPGDSASADAAWWQDTTLRDSHDIILIDQRGSGHSRPSLNCPEFDASDEADRLARCRERLLAAGINLSAYSATSIAQDIVDLVTALELDDVNIYARSYGARPALILAGELPQRIRAMVLEGAYTGSESAFENAAANALQSLQLLFDDCRADQVCRAAYPTLEAQFSRSAAALNTKPIAIDEILPGAALRLDGESYMLLLRSMLADSSRLRYIPALVAAIAENDLAYLASPEGAWDFRAAPALQDAHSEGLYFGALCADEAALTSPELIKAGGTGLPAAFRPLVAAALRLLEDCSSWLHPGRSVNFAPQPDDIPTLYLNGAYDPIAPVSALSFESPLINRLTFPHLGHGALQYDSCVEALVAAYLAHPTDAPFDSCLEELRPPLFFVREDR